MRAVTGTITATRPSSTVKAARILQRFEKSAPSGLLSSDTATYLRTAIEAAAELNQFRSYLRVHQQRVGGGESERKRRPAPVDEDSRWEPKVEEEEDEYSRWEPKVQEEEQYGMTVPAAAENKSSERKASREDEEPWEEKQGTATEKRMKKKEKRVKDEDEAGDAIEEQSRTALDDALQGMVSKEGIGSAKKADKKKKKHIKQEDLGAEEAEQKMVHVGVAENGLASEEKRRKKRKHTGEEVVKKEVVDDGDLGSDKKRKKKGGRDGDNGNDTELVEHTKKKQRK